MGVRHKDLNQNTQSFVPKEVQRVSLCGNEPTTVAGISIQTYREVLKDQVSSDSQIVSRLKYLDAFCRGIIRQEIQSYAEQAT